MNIGVHVSFWNNVFGFFIYITKCGTAESYGNSIFSSLRKLHTILTVAVPINIPTNSAEGFLLLHTLSNTYYLCLFNNSHSDKPMIFESYIILFDLHHRLKRHKYSECEVVSHYGFYLHFLIINDVEHLFMCLLAICIFTLENVYLFNSSARF